MAQTVIVLRENDGEIEEDFCFIFTKVGPL